MTPFRKSLPQGQSPATDAVIADAPAVQNVNLANGRRLKSPYRDARFRPVFQALAALQSVRAAGGTSVSYATPSHPLFSILSLNPTTLPVLDTLPPFPLTAEDLSEDELHSDARHWRQFNVETPRSHRTPAEWRDLSDQYKIEWLHHGLRLEGDTAGFSLQLNDKTADLLSAGPDAARWMGKRLDRRLKQVLGYAPAFWFLIEQGDRRRLHLHGEIAVRDQALLPDIRKAFRLAAGEWTKVRQHQAHTYDTPDVWWTNYVTKDAYLMRKRPKGMRIYLPRPIDGNWYSATADLRKKSAALYEACREQVLVVLKALPASGSPSVTQGSPLASVEDFPAHDSLEAPRTHQRLATADLEPIPSPDDVEHAGRGPP